MSKRSLFQIVAKENLIDQAAEVNQTAESTDPKAQQSAVDFDAELKRLQEDQAENTDAAVGSDTPAAEPVEGAETADSEASGGETLPADSADAPTGDASEETTEDKQPEQDSTKEPESEEASQEVDAEQDPAATAEPSAPEVNLERAAECISRLTRCLQSLETAHDTGVVSPELAAIANGEADMVVQVMDLDVPSAPALETLRASTESSRFAETRDRIKQVLVAAWKRFMEWVNKIVAWISQFRRAYHAKKGIYEKTAAGYALRLKALQKEGVQLSADVEVNFGVLSSIERHSGMAALIDSAVTLGAVSTGLIRFSKSVHVDESIASVVDVYQQLAGGSPMADSVDLFKPLDILGALKVTGSSDIITATNGQLTHESKAASNNSPGGLRISGLPGDLVLQWTAGPSDKFYELSEAIAATAMNNFMLVKDTKSESTQETLTMSTTEIEQLLTLHKAMLTNQDHLLQALVTVERNLGTVRDLNKRMASAMQDINTQLSGKVLQDLVRLGTLVPVAYERTVAGPMNEMLRVQNNGVQTVLRIAGNGLAALDAAFKAQRA